MITLAFNGNTYQLPTNYDELTWQQYCSVINNLERPILDRLHTVTKIPIDDLLQLSVIDFGKLCEILSFIDIPQVGEHYGYSDIDINVGAGTYGQLEKARQAITQSKHWVLAAQKVGLIYLNEDINDLNLAVAMGKVKAMFHAINSFLNKYKDLWSVEVEAEEEMAGAEVFRKFGSFPTIDRLAITYGKSHDEVLEMAAEIVYTKLLYDKESSQYNERLMKIKSAIK